MVDVGLAHSPNSTVYDVTTTKSRIIPCLGSTKEAIFRDYEVHRRTIVSFIYWPSGTIPALV